MAIRYLGKWDKSPDGDSPTVWVDDTTGDYYVQGWDVSAGTIDEQLLPASGRPEIPAGETVVRIPGSMAKHFTGGR